VNGREKKMRGEEETPLEVFVPPKLLGKVLKREMRSEKNGGLFFVGLLHLLGLVGWD
jgi:hypothetical protein